jgi:hypothetical protein
LRALNSIINASCNPSHLRCPLRHHHHPKTLLIMPQHWKLWSHQANVPTERSPILNPNAFIVGRWPCMTWLPAEALNEQGWWGPPSRQGLNRGRRCERQPWTSEDEWPIDVSTGLAGSLLATSADCGPHITIRCRPDVSMGGLRRPLNF